MRGKTVDCASALLLGFLLVGCAAEPPRLAAPTEIAARTEFHPIGDTLTMMVLRQKFAVRADGGQSSINARAAALATRMSAAMKISAAREAQRRGAQAFGLSIEEDRSRFGARNPANETVAFDYDVDVLVLFFASTDQAPKEAYLTRAVLEGG